MKKIDLANGQVGMTDQQQNDLERLAADLSVIVSGIFDQKMGFIMSITSLEEKAEDQAEGVTFGSLPPEISLKVVTGLAKKMNDNKEQFLAVNKARH